MRKSHPIRVSASVCLMAAVSLAQPAPEAPAVSPPAPAAPEQAAGGVNFSGLVDAYYSLNFNHPSSGVNNVRNFDVKANQFSLNMAKLTVEQAPAPLGFRVDLGIGRAFDIAHAAEPAPDIFRYLEQAYVSYKPAKAKGLVVDFGEFVTWAGAEVIETRDNWNYSRSLLFALAIPYYHFGVRATMPIAGGFSAGAALVNGWNNIEDNNTGKTAVLSGTYGNQALRWTHNYLVGSEKAGTNKGLRHLYDTTLLLTPSPKAGFYINFDYGVDRDISGGGSRWVGLAGAARFELTRRFALAPRLEWFNDAGGFATGTAQRIKEATLTGEIKLKEGVLTRLEYRRDWSNQPFFDRGNDRGLCRGQDTLLAGFVVFFGPQR